MAGSYGSSISIFFKKLYTVSIVFTPIYTLTNSASGFLFLHILANIYYL